MYNRDPDSLAEYEFKIGTYASFDRGRQLVRPRPAEHLPAGAGAAASWPLEQHVLSGRRPGPRRHRARGRGRPARSGDFGEEYITSDVWADFDDEGNAYAMVLDSPPFPSGNGWGMSFHRWETPSMRDIRSGRTWSNRIIIDAHPTEPEQSTTLDDKNTFAVNNAGRDHDGRTGIIVACWGLNYELDRIGRQRTSASARPTAGARGRTRRRRSRRRRTRCCRSGRS